VFGVGVLSACRQNTQSARIPNHSIRKYVLRQRSLTEVTHQYLFAFASKFANTVLIAGCLAAFASESFAQGGGNANAVGLSIQNSANSAAATQNSAAMGSPGGSAGGALGMTPGSEVMIDSGGGSAYSTENYTPEMAGSEMYNQSNPGGGYGGATRPGQMGIQGMLMSFGGSYLSGLAEFLNQPLSPDAVRFKPTLAEQAALAIHFGDQRRALALFQAHLIANRDSAAQGLEQIRYNPLGRQPSWAIRVGVSLHPRVADSFIDDPQPIREDDVATMPNNRQGGMAYGGNRPRGRAGQMAGGSAGMESGAAMVEAAGMMDASGAMPGGSPGELGSEGMMGADGTMMPGGGRPAKLAPAVNPAIAAAAAAQKSLDDHLGIIADLVKSQLSARFTGGKFGVVLPELANQGKVLGDKLLASGASLPMGTSGAVMMWVPGVDYLGTGDANSMIAKCRENEIDVLLHFDVLVKETRGEPQYDARCRLINCATGENISVSKSINKRDVLLAARKRTNAQVVAELMQPVFDGLDAKVFVMPMPPLQPQHAVARIDSLLAKPVVVRPDNLAEIAMFHQKRLIDDQQFEQVMFFAAGEDGLRLLYGTAEERAELVDRFVRVQLGLD